MHRPIGFKYSGADNLDVMSSAVNYNAYLLRLISKYCSTKNNILDFGAGIGTFSLPLHSENKNIIAVEPDETQCRRLSSFGIKNFPGLEYVENQWADVIFSINVIEHIESDERVLAELLLKLKPAGIVIIYVPAFNILYSAMDKKVGHFRRYSQAELIGKMKRAGFEIVASHYADSLGFFASLVFKCFFNSDGNVNRTALRLFDRYVFPLSCIFDRVTSRWFGKNLIVVARRKC